MFLGMGDFFSMTGQFLKETVERLHRRLSNKQFLIVGAVIVGLWAGLTAVILKITVHYLQEYTRVLGMSYSWTYLITPAIGILLTVLFVRYVLKGDLAKGTSHVLLAIARKSSFLPRKETFTHMITSALTVGFGGSAGLESPIVQTGSAIGSTFSSFFPIGYRDRTLLLACGAAAGIATAFNAPIAGVLFALEVLLVDISITAFIPLLIAGATGALCSKIILSEGILLSFKHISDFNYHNVPHYIVLGIICGLVSVYYLKAFRKAESWLTQRVASRVLRFLIGVTVLGVLIMLFPPLFGEGYVSIITLATLDPQQLAAGSPLAEFVRHPVSLGLFILAVGLIKVFAVSCTLTAGGNGGNFAPSLLVGACIGFAYAFLFNASGLAGLPASNYTVVAMAGVLTGIFHAPLTAIFLIAEITGGYELIIPLMIVSALSTAVSKYLHPHSLDEIKLGEEEGTVAINKDTHILSDMATRGFIETDFVPIHKDATLRVLVASISRSARNIFPVVDDNHALAGVVALENIREIMFNTEAYDSTIVSHLMQQPVAVADVKDDMRTIMQKFDKTGVWNIPVLDNGKYIGFISKSRIFSNYRDKLKGD
jgi:CIC family chloride channel protein